MLSGANVLLGMSYLVNSAERQRSNQLNYVPFLLFMRLASNQHVCCRFLLSTKSPASPRSTRYIEIPEGNGQHGQQAKPPPILTADNQRSGASVPAPRVDCNRAWIHPSGPGATCFGRKKAGRFALLFLTSFSKNNNLGVCFSLENRSLTVLNTRGSDTVLAQAM